MGHPLTGTADCAGETRKSIGRWTKPYGKTASSGFAATGLRQWHKTGCKGWIGLHELLISDGDVKRLVQERARVAEILAAAAEGGMRTLTMDGMEKIMVGLTDVKMVRSVCIK